MKYIFYFLLVLLLSLGIGLATGFIKITHVEETYVREIEGTNPLPGYCLRGIYEYGKGGFGITEPTAGEFDYQIIATSRGYEVWEKCK